MWVSNASSLDLLPRHPETWPSHHNVEVHAKDTDTGIVSCSQVDVFLDTETEVPHRGEVLPPQLILLHLQTTFENFLSFRPPDGDVHGDLLITSDAEGTDGVAGFGGDGRLASELF